MPDQPLTGRQTVALLTMFIFGSSAVLGVSSSVGQDAWISLILGMLFSIPVLMGYARISRLNPGANLFEIFERTMGKVVGKLATLLMTWYAIHLCALVMRNFSEFLMITSLLETPQAVVLAVMLATVGMLARSGPKALGKWSVIIFPVVFGMVAATVLLSYNIYHTKNIFPFFEHGLAGITGSAFQTFSFPFTETVLFLGIADSLDPRASAYRAYFWAALISTGILMLVTLRNLMVLGPVLMSSAYFPSYVAARIISIGDFLSRIEGSISVNFILAGITKITLCLIVASRGLSRLVGVPDWRNMVFPTGFVAFALALILYHNTMQMYAFVNYYPYYALPFQVVLPFLTWIISEVRARRKKNAVSA